MPVPVPDLAQREQRPDGRIYHLGEPFEVGLGRKPAAGEDGRFQGAVGGELYELVLWRIVEYAGREKVTPRQFQLEVGIVVRRGKARFRIHLCPDRRHLLLPTEGVFCVPPILLGWRALQRQVTHDWRWKAHLRGDVPAISHVAYRVPQGITPQVELQDQLVPEPP